MEYNNERRKRIFKEDDDDRQGLRNISNVSVYVFTTEKNIRLLLNEI